MQSRVQKWGNSLGIRIPKSIVQKAKLNEGTTVDFSIRGNAIVITPRQYSLEEMLSRITTENLHEEIDAGNPVGREIW